IASCTAASASGLTEVEPLTTRDTVERETPADAATSSMVALMLSPLSVRKPGLHRPGRDDPSVLPAGVLHDALLGVVLDAHDAEALPVSPRPLVVVEQRPVEVSAHVDTRVDRVGDRLHVLDEEVRAVGVGHPVALAHVVVGGAVLGDV